MKQLKFKSYDSGFVRAYFKHDKTLYCVQPGMFLLPELLVCSRDGEPSHPVEDGINYTLTNMPPDGDDWNWCEVIAFYNDVESNGQLMRRMNDMFEMTE